MTSLASGSIYNLSLGYAPNGDVKSANDSANGNWAYGYDDFNRLTTANATGQAYTYAYDRFGNRWRQNGPQTMDLTFSGGNNHIDGYSYDAAGNLTYDGGHTYFYDAEHHLVQVDGSAGYCQSGTGAQATSCYTYDAEGRRVRRTVPGSGITDDYIYDLGGHAITQMSGGGWWIRGEIYAGGRHLATYENDLGTPTTFFVQTDWLGTERVQTAVNGTACETITSLPFGDGLNTSGSCDPSALYFTGKIRDWESNLDYFGIRYFGSSLGRFMSPDSIANDWELRKPQTWNRYAYARNNPLIYVDPDGAAVELICTGGNADQCKAQREQELASLQKNVGNEDAASRLYINEVKDGDHTRYFVGIKGDVGNFMKFSDTAHDLANLVEDKQVVEFGLTNRDLSAFGGAVTYQKGEAGNQNVRVLVNPDEMDVADRVLNPDTILGASRWAGQNQDPRWAVQPFTPGIAEWHEFGHSWGYIHGRIGGASNSEALQWENRMREQVYGPLGPNNAPRIVH